MKDLIVECPECETEMELFGIFASGALKYYCNNCYRILTETESAKYTKEINLVDKGAA